MIRSLSAAGLLIWFGATLLLSTLRWFRQPELAERLRAYSPEGMRLRRSAPASGPTAVLELLAPLAAAIGNRLARALGVQGDTADRLLRAGHEPDVSAFRLRQGAWAVVALFAAALIAAAAQVGVPVAIAMMLAAPILAFLVLENNVVVAASNWQQHLLLELPVTIEQLGMLLSSGYSLGSALSRLSRRSNGICARELAEVSRRIRQGVSEIEALREFARRADVAALDRLVGVLALNWEASDLGSLISAEARSVRREVHRQQIETIEKRAQQVWIPVTVATLVPGVIFMAVPFIDAMGRLTQ
jgi:Flp pilus assembly protein TadB